MKFFMTQGSCSTGIHILLEEVEALFEVYVVNLMAGDHQAPDYLKINPKGTIPALQVEEGWAITDFQSIAYWIAKQHPKQKLLPDHLRGEIEALEWMNYAVNVIHGQGFTRIFTTDKYAIHELDSDAIKQQGEKIVAQGFELVSTQLVGKTFLLGDQFTIADAALFYVEFWADHIQLPLPDLCRKHYQACLKRPSVRQVLMEEGYASVLNR